MATRIYISANFIYKVTETGSEEKPLNVTRPYVRGRLHGIHDSLWVGIEDETFADAGMFIKQVGGVGRLLSECIEVNDLDAYVAELNESARKEHEKNHQLAMEREERLAKEAEEEYHRIFANEVTETNAKSVYTLLRYLNTQNWGGWTLPKMTIGYACHQYDCDGKIATTIKLDKPIRVAGEEGTWFQYGAPHRHLMKYRRIFDSEE